ncbi:MAG: hypothetical protein NTZ52_00905 [Chlamydiae bacterium]|nr:hypothetical protein [Chlamydiota bacterium]
MNHCQDIRKKRTAVLEVSYHSTQEQLVKFRALLAGNQKITQEMGNLPDCTYDWGRSVKKDSSSYNRIT